MATRGGCGSDGAAARLGETARRAGIGSFVALSCAAFALVWASFTNDYSVSYILHHTNRDLNTAYKFSALWSRAGGLAAAVGVAAERVWVCAADAAQGGCAADGVCFDDPGGDSGFLFAAAELCGAAVCDSAGAGGAGWVWVESAAAVSGDGDSSADALSGLCGILGAVCVCAGRADDAVSGGEVDPHYAAMDDGDVAVSDVRDFSGRALGL